MLKRLICAAFVVALVGCKTEIVETKVKTSEIRKSISGEMVTVPFSAVLEVLGGDASPPKTSNTAENGTVTISPEILFLISDVLTFVSTISVLHPTKATTNAAQINLFNILITPTRKNLSFRKYSL